MRKASRMLGVSGVFVLLLATGCSHRTRAQNTPPAPNPTETSPTIRDVAQTPPAEQPERRHAEPTPAPPAPTPSAPKKLTLEERLSQIQDAFFDYDRHHLRPDARGALKSDADVVKAILSDMPATRLVIEGHCDERGSAEYNLALGDLRARATREFLVEFGVPGRQLNVISYGKERPQCTERTEDCWQKNRRAHLTATP